MNRDISLKYTGQGVKDGSIEASDLVCGLGGFVKLSSVIINKYKLSKDHDVSLRIKDFDEGSVDIVLVFIEQHPVLIGSVTTVVVAVIGALAHYFKRGEIRNPENPEAMRVLHYLLLDESSIRGLKKGFRGIALPLNSKGVSTVEVGYRKSTKEIMNQDDKDCFLDEDLSEEGHKRVTKSGELRALDKKTLNGKFVTIDDETYPISLAMGSPEAYFMYFDKAGITISGMAIYEKESGKIIKIEIDRIS